MIRRIDLRDFKEDTLELPVFLSNISVQRSKPFVYCLSRLSSAVYKVFIDTSLLVNVKHTEFGNPEGIEMSSDFNFTLVESSDNLISIIGEKERSADTHVNRVMLFDLDLNLVAKKDQTIIGKGTKR